VVVRSIRGIPGVVRAELLENPDRERLRTMDTRNAAENQGVAEVLTRDHVLCLFKDASFRPPPEPTLLLVDEAGTVIGRELVVGETPPQDRRMAYLGKDFVLFAGAKPEGSVRFLLPAVRFPELEGIQGVSRVVSASPDTPQDEYLRRRFVMPTGREFASVLVGYDVRNP
jgi:hypothetical protein